MGIHKLLTHLCQNKSVLMMDDVGVGKMLQAIICMQVFLIYSFAKGKGYPGLAGKYLHTGCNVIKSMTCFQPVSSMQHSPRAPLSSFVLQHWLISGFKSCTVLCRKEHWTSLLSREAGPLGRAGGRTSTTRAPKQCFVGSSSYRFWYIF